MRSSRRLTGGVRADPDAKALAHEMAQMHDVMREILDETIPEGDGAQVTESGRTLCGHGSNIHGPLARFPTAVELASCPVNTRGGTWHTHVTKDQLRTPTNSLPDTANVIFGEIDVSAVVGTQSVDIVMAAAEPDAAVAEFQDALGVGAASSDDVVDAIIQGRIADPPDARRRVRSRLGGLFDQRSVNFSDLDRRIETSGIPAHSVVNFEVVDAQHHAIVAQELRQRGMYADHSKHPLQAAATKRYLRAKNHGIKRGAARINAGEVAAQSAIGEVVSRAMSALL